MNNREDLHAKLVAFLSGQFARKDKQATELHLYYAYGAGSRDEELESWTREEKPEMFETLALVEKIAETIISRAEQHVDSFAAGRHRYIVRVKQHLGSLPSYPFSLVPQHSLNDETQDGGGGMAMTAPGSARDVAGALARGFDVAMRSNTLMHTGTVQMMVSTNKMLSEENVNLRERVRDLERDLDEARSVKHEREWRMQREAKKEDRTDMMFGELFSFGRLAVTKALGGASGGANAPDRIMILLHDLKDSIQPTQVQALMQVFSPAQLNQFIEIMQIVEAVDGEKAEKAAKTAQPPNGANGHQAHP